MGVGIADCHMLDKSDRCKWFLLIYCKANSGGLTKIDNQIPVLGLGGF